MARHHEYAARRTPSGSISGALRELGKSPGRQSELGYNEANSATHYLIERFGMLQDSGGSRPPQGQANDCGSNAGPVAAFLRELPATMGRKPWGDSVSGKIVTLSEGPP